MDEKQIQKILEICKETRCPDTFFQEIIYNNYSELSHFKTSEISWYKYFLHIIYYISKLKEEFGYTYIGGNPETIYKQFPKKNMVQLSNVMEAHSITTEDTKFYLFGEKHDIIPLCVCKTLDSGLNPVNNESSCWDLPRLFSDIFNQEKKKGNYVDVYIEVPFLKNRPDFSYKSKDEGLSKILTFFIKCFYAKKCPWPNVRFHYTDIRILEFGAGGRDSGFPSLLWDDYYEPITRRLTNSFIRKDNEFIIGKEFTKIDNIEEFDFLVTELFKNRSINDFFNIYLSSDNYINDIRKISKKITEKIPSLEKRFYEKNLIHRKYEKVTHRIRTQFLALEKEGQNELADKIKEFILKKLKIVSQQLIEAWEEIYDLYLGIIHGDIKSIDRDAYFNLRHKLGHAITDVGVLFVDAYTLARSFRTFPMTSHIPSKIRIFFNGRSHTQNYAEFIEQTFHTLDSYEARKDKDDLECLYVDINKFLD